MPQPAYALRNSNRSDTEHTRRSGLSAGGNHESAQQHRAPSAAAARIVKVDQRVERANVLRVQALRDQRAESLSKSQTAPSRERRLLAAESDLLSTFRPDG